MDVHQWHVIPGHMALSYLFLYFSVLTFTLRTARNNALARVSKSRTRDTRSDCVAAESYACRVGPHYTRTALHPLHKCRGLRAVL